MAEDVKITRTSIQTLGRQIVDRRKGRGVREIANEIGISPATLSRVERGYMPDLETFTKICRWLNVNPGTVLGFKPQSTQRVKASVHFKKDHTIRPETAKALGMMILQAQRALEIQEELEG
ncbi:MAG: helix-turn-helix transcriptional regulator [Defluviicoccus sp.]|nr:helix-turn-helix transcriptional regulator [Defluviicoccus sp.]